MGLVPARRPGWLLEPRRKSRPRGMAAHPRSSADESGGQNPAYRPSGVSPRSQWRGDFPKWTMDGEAEEIGRLGIPALALLRREGPGGGEAAPVRSRGLQGERRPPRAQGAQQPRALVFLRDARGGIQQELELLRQPEPRGSGQARSRGGAGQCRLSPVRPVEMGWT